MSKKRIDILLVDMGLCDSREKARARIMSGDVYIDGQRALKPGQNVDESSRVELTGGKPEFVSRGGYKLDKALRDFDVSPEGKICIDCGASTGGFTDCLLKNGAVKVYSVDVGYGQLAWSIRTDPRVVVMERTNIRHVTREQIPDEPELAVIDVSFISLRLVLPVVNALLRDKGTVLCLIKPQFEAGRENVGKNGVVRDRKVHIQVLEDFLSNAHDAGFYIQNLTYSPIKGPKGNIEYLAHLISGEGEDFIPDIVELVDRSHRELDV
ncbi:MAG: TlyA family RNA methyltransferase [Oscillospiraceae bacterium]|nr:TlyA family RNA methyltransferase [Oscillospiraceae bacterium]